MRKPSYRNSSLDVYVFSILSLSPVSLTASSMPACPDLWAGTVHISSPQLGAVFRVWALSGAASSLPCLPQQLHVQGLGGEQPEGQRPRGE